MEEEKEGGRHLWTNDDDVAQIAEALLLPLPLSRPAKEEEEITEIDR